MPEITFIACWSSPIQKPKVRTLIYIKFLKNHFHLYINFYLFAGNSKTSGKEVPCETHKRSIIETIKKSVDESTYESENEMASNEIDEEMNAEIEYLEQLSSPFTKWLDDIVESAKLTIIM